MDTPHDEFILHIRKNHPNRWSNDQLAKKTWEFLRDHADGTKVAEDVPCLWNTTIKSRNPEALPRTAAQFEFRADALPTVFRFLRELAERKPKERGGGGQPPRAEPKYPLGEEEFNPFPTED